MVKVNVTSFKEFNDHTRLAWKIEDILRDNNDPHKDFETYNFIMDNGNTIVFQYNRNVIPEVKFDNNRMRFMNFMNDIDIERISSIGKANLDGQFENIAYL